VLHQGRTSATACDPRLLRPALVTGKGHQRKKRKKATYLPAYLFLRFFEIFRSDFRKCFCGVFGLLMQRNGQKRDNKIIREKTTDDRKKVVFFSTFSAKRLLTWIFPKFFFCGVFELPLLRNTQKRH
jgi:hypothetical protein